MLKSILFISLSFLLFYSITAENEPEYKTFNEWRIKYLEDYTDDELHPRVVDGNCVEQKLNFQKNGEKIIERRIGLETIGAGYTLCTEGIEEIWEMAVWFFSQSVQEEYESKVDCFKQGLKELEPDAKIVENFDPSSMTISSEECQETIESEKFKKILKDLLGDTFTEGKSCDTITSDEIKAFAFRIIILRFGSVTDADSEKKICAKIIGSLQNRVFDCQMQIINEM